MDGWINCRDAALRGIDRISPQFALFCEPLRPEFTKFVDPEFGDFITPQRNGSAGQAEHPGKIRSIPREFYGVDFSHVQKFITINPMDTSPINEIAGLIPDMSLKERIRELIAAGYRKTDLAKAAGKSRAAVSHWLTGDTLEIKSDTAAGLQKLTGYNAVWISTGKGVKKVSGNTSPGPTINKIPLLTNSQAGMYIEEIEELRRENKHYEEIQTTIEINEYTFALRVTGDSMEPEFPAGIVLIVEPDLKAVHEDYVIAKGDAQETTFKQLVEDGGEWFLKPLNSRYPIKPLGNHKIIGVVRGAEKRYR